MRIHASRPICLMSIYIKVQYKNEYVKRYIIFLTSLRIGCRSTYVYEYVCIAYMYMYGCI